MPRKLPPHLHHEMTRHGSLVWYVRKGHGPRIRLREDYDTDKFWEEYRVALATPSEQQISKTISRDTFAWAVNRYRASAAWGALAKATQKQRNAVYKSLEKTIGAEPLARITVSTIKDTMDARSDRPHAANNFLKAMRGFYAWATGDVKLAPEDPTQESTMLHGPNEKIGHHTWTEEELERFEARWPLGTRARLAFDLLLYTGLRRGDVVKIGRQHVRDGVITVRTEKTGSVVYRPILAPLAKSIKATKTGDMAFLVTRSGTPFTKESFGNWFSDCCRAARCPGSSHGLRKAGATRAANNGATERQLMAMYGWADGKEARHYTEAANDFRLAVEGSEFLLPRAPAPSQRRSRTVSKGLK